MDKSLRSPALWSPASVRERDAEDYVPIRLVGLAAPRGRASIQLAIIEDRAENLRDLDPERLGERERKPVPFQVIVNVRISSNGVIAEFFEGCLSKPSAGTPVDAVKASAGYESTLSHASKQAGVMGHGRETTRWPIGFDEKDV